MRTLGRFVALLLLVGFVGAYFWPIALTIAAATIAFHLVLRRLTRDRKRHRERGTEVTTGIRVAAIASGRVPRSSGWARPANLFVCRLTACNGSRVRSDLTNGPISQRPLCQSRQSRNRGSKLYAGSHKSIINFRFDFASLLRQP